MTISPVPFQPSYPIPYALIAKRLFPVDNDKKSCLVKTLFLLYFSRFQLKATV